MTTLRTSLSRFVVSALVLGSLALTVACGDDEEEAAAADAKTSCESMCKAAGYAAGTATEYPHEINCVCANGAGTVTAEACTNMCKGLGKAGQVYGAGAGNTANACQCD